MGVSTPGAEPGSLKWELVLYKWVVEVLSRATNKCCVEEPPTNLHNPACIRAFLQTLLPTLRIIHPNNTAGFFN